MNVSINRKAERYVRDKLRSGQFISADDVVNEALEFRQREERARNQYDTSCALPPRRGSMISSAAILRFGILKK
jgi:Arc/MetJ-type ribon-helix-helix transcriptional regulator